MKHFFTLLTLFLALISYRCHGQAYQLTDLGALIGTNSYAQGINNQGQVVGYWVTTDGSHAFLYQAGAVTDLGLLGGTNNYALSINNAGQVVGFAETTNGSRAFLYQDGVMTNLGGLGGSGSYAFGINGSGQIVGHVDTPNGARAIMYDTGSIINIGTLGGTNSYAFGINNVLQVAGSSLTADNATTHAFLWQSGTMDDLNQLQTNTGGWELIDAHGINDFGNIAGWGVINNQEHAFLFSINGVTTDLGVLAGGTNSYALGLNNANQIVGASLTLTGNHAVIWQNRIAIDLNNLIDASGWELKEACGINDLGQIVGWGIVYGQEHAFLLNQTPLRQSSVGAASNASVSPSDSLGPLVNSLTVTITNPVNNATFPSPTNIAINATTADSGGTVTQVQFYVGARLLGTDTTSPYGFVWTNASVGVHSLTAVARDNIGQVATSSAVNVSISTNLLPIADAHVRDGSYTNTNFGTNIVMECLTTNGSGNNRDIYFKFDLASVSNISSARLRVFAKLGGSGSVSNTVYSVTNTSWTETGIKWTNKPARVTALTTNSVTGTNWYLFDVTSFIQSQKNAGSNVVSLALHDPTNYSLLISINSKENSTNKPSLLIVTTNSSLSVSITNPVNNAIFPSPANLAIGANVSDSDGTVTQVQFFQGTTSLGIVTNAPYRMTWSNATSGIYALTAVARDNGGILVTSGVVNVIVDIPPAVTLTNPANNTVCIAGSSIALGASASDADGTVRQVQFFQGTTSLGVVTNSPYILVCNSINVGTNALTAQAMDNNGMVTTSAPVNLIVKTPVLGMTAWWKAEGNAFDSIGTNNSILQGGGVSYTNGVVGQAFSFDGTSGYVSVPDSQSLDPSNAITVECWIYRQSVVGSYDPVIKKSGLDNYGYSMEFSGNNIMFWICNNGWNSSPSGPIQLNQWYHVAGVYDGTNLMCYVNGQMVGSTATSGSITASSAPLCLAADDASNPSRFFNGLVDEASVYNRALSSNEIAAIYNAGSAGKSSMFLNVTLTNPVNNALFPTGSSINLGANASDANGMVEQVQFFQGTTSLGIVTNAPYNLTWSNAASGTYALTAVAVDNYGITATSGVVNMIVDIPPSVTLTNPANNTIAVAGSSIALGASASDADGTVAQVQFFQGTTSMGVVTNSPYILVCSVIGVGTNVFTAQAMDNNGMVTTSAPVDLVVKSPIPGMAAWWQAEDNTLDSIGANNGTLQGGAGYTNGMVGQAFSFDGDTGGMSVNAMEGLVSGNTPHTIEGWIKIQGLPSARSWMLLLGPEASGSHHWLLLPNGSTQLGVWGGAQASPTLPVGVWVHLAVTFDGSTLGCYINGVLQSSRSASFSFPGSPPLTLALPHNYEEAFNGVMDEFSIYNRALSANEIAAIYDAGSAGKSPAFLYATLTDPINNEVFPIGSSINLSANVSYVLSTVTQVEFFQGATSLGIVTNVPYNVTWSNATSGAYALTAVARDNGGIMVTSRVVNVIVDIPPTVTLANPANNAMIPAGSINLVASASDADGTVAQVQFFQGTTSLGIVTNAPYNLTWSNAISGAYSLTAVATDNNGLVATSTVVSVIVDMPSTVSITSPANNALIISAQTNLALTASAGDSDGTVVQVQFFQGTTSLGIVTNAPYNLVWSNVTAGVYALTACATDNNGLTTASAVVNVVVTPISISITNPANNAVLIASQTNLTVMAAAGDIVGTVTQVEFFQGSASLGIATSLPYSIVWNNVVAGGYALTAVATDDSGLTATSPVVNLTITTLLATNNLYLWLKADAISGLTNNAPVSTWPDSSGWNNNATQGDASRKPLYVTNVLNGLPVVRYTGGQCLSLPNFLTPLTQAEAFAVVKAAPVGNNYQSLWFLGGSGNAYDEEYPLYDGSIHENFGSTVSYNLGVPAQPLNQYHMYEVAAQTNNWAAWINGVLLFQRNINTVAFSSSPILSGAYNNVDTPTFFHGDMVEILIFDRVLTADERATVNGYLNVKYGIMAAVSQTPANLMANAISQTQIGLTWNGTLTNGGTAQISVERKTGINGTYAQVARIANALSYVDTNLTAGMTYYYRVRAINLNTWSPYSNETDATTLSSGLDVPFGSLALWLKADAGLAQGGMNTPVGFWADQSGNGNNAQQTAASQRPMWVPDALNGLPVVRYTGGQYLTLPNFLTPLTQAEAFAVVKAAPVGNNCQSLWYLGGSENAYDEEYPLYDGSIHENFGSTSSYNLGVPAQSLNQYHMYEVAARSNNWAAWINGVLLFQRNVNTVAFSSSPILSGAYNNVDTPTFFHGDMVEILVFDRVLTTDERAAVNGYLDAKYGFAAPVQVTPTNLVATAISTTQVELTWDEECNSGTTQVAIERSTTSNGVYQMVAQLTNATSYVDTNLTGGTTYYYQVRAINWLVPYDFNQWSPTSNVAQATTPANGMDVPFGSLALWLKADAGLMQGNTNTPVNLWADQSGNGNDATQPAGANQPAWVRGAIGGRPVVRFNGDQYLNLPDFLWPLTQAEVFVVLKADSVMPASNMGAMRLGPNGDEYPATNGKIIEDFGTMTARSLVSALQPLNQFNLYNIQADSNSWVAELNGTTLLAATNDAFEVTLLPTLGSSTQPFAGDIAEVMIFNRTLTAAERASVENYLNQRYMLVTTPPPAPVLTGSTNSDGSVTLGWAGITNATGYLVERAVGTNGAFGVIATLPYGTETSYADVNVSSGLPYVYRIQAVNLAGISVPSNQVQRPLSGQETIQDDILEDYLEGIDPTAGIGGVNPALINLQLYTPLK